MGTARYLCTNCNEWVKEEDVIINMDAPDGIRITCKRCGKIIL